MRRNCICMNCHLMHHVQSARASEAGEYAHVPVWNGCSSMACKRISRCLAMIGRLGQRVHERVDVRAIPAAVERVRQYLADDLVVLSIDRLRLASDPGVSMRCRQQGGVRHRDAGGGQSCRSIVASRSVRTLRQGRWRMSLGLDAAGVHAPGAEVALIAVSARALDARVCATSGARDRREIQPMVTADRVRRDWRKCLRVLARDIETVAGA